MARPHTGDDASAHAFTPLAEISYFKRALGAGALPAAPPVAPSLGGGAGGTLVETPMWYYEDAAGCEQFDSLEAVLLEAVAARDAALAE